jgi:hypothetical protein
MTRQLGQGMAPMRAASGGSPVTGRAPTEVVDRDEALGAVGSARVAIHQCGGQRGWRARIWSVFYEIRAPETAIYWDFFIKS